MFEESNYSRVPVYKGGIQKIEGIMYRTDFYEMLLNGGNDISSILKPVLYTAPDEKISVLFKMLQKSQQPIAVVKSDNKIIGLISIDDILEELVGEIDDKYDIEKTITWRSIGVKEHDVVPFFNQAISYKERNKTNSYTR